MILKMYKNEHQKNEKFFLWLYRGLGIFAAVTIPATHFLVEDAQADPMWPRWIASGVLVLTVLSSFFTRMLIERFIPIISAIGLVITLNLEYIAVVSGMAHIQFFGYFIALLSFSFISRGLRYYLILYLSNLVMAVVLFGMLDMVGLDWVGFAFAFAITMAFGLCLALSRQRTKKNLEGKEKMLRLVNEAAFRQTSAGIMVTDRGGKVFNFNEKLQKFWNLDPAAVEEGKFQDLVKLAQNQLKNPLDSMQAVAAIRKNPMIEINDVLEMKDGRFLNRITKPLLNEGEIVGRIWFYHDITPLKLEEARLESTREQMYRQNEVMVHLAGSNAVNEGDLEIAFQDVIRAVVTGMGTDGAEIWLLDESGQTLKCHSRYNLARNLPKESLPLAEADHPAFFKAIQVSKTVAAADAAQDPRTASLPGVQNDYGSILVVAVRLHGKVVGLVRTHNRRRLHEWPVESCNFLASISDLLAVLMETAERRKAEFQLEKSHAILQAVFELSGLGILVTTNSGDIITYNRLYLDMWRLDDEYLEKKPASTVIAFCQAQLRNAEQVRSSMTFLLENPDQDQFDFLEFNDGRFVERFTSVLEVEGQIIGRVWFFRDITDRIEAERRLRDSELRNKAILNVLPDLMLRLDMSGKVIDFKTPDSDSFPTLTENLRGSNVRNAFPESFAKAALAQAAEVQESSMLQSFEVEMNLIGQVRDYEVRIVPSNSREVLLIVRDITERKRAEKELVQRNFELDSFVYRASHDLKAPLNSLMGLIDIVRNENADSSILMYLGLMDKSVVKLDTFIRNLTDFSRINRLQIEHQEVAFAEMVEDIGESLRYMEHADRVRRILTVDDSVQLYADAFHIGIVLSNLISNAIKYQDHSKDDSHVKIEVKVSPEQAVIEVSDNGMGIPPEHQDRIFELFFRASNQSFGSGLGLYITRNAVEKMSGTISFVSTPGEGTRFTIVLPNQLKPALAGE